jgi:hypothetical protein
MNFLTKIIPSSDRSILLASLGLFLVASLLLFSASHQALDPDQNKNWWSVDFDHPTDSSTDFTIVNHTPTTDFSYSLSSGDTSTNLVSITIPSGATQTFTPAAPEASSTSLRLTIRHGGESREIHKNLR